ncbi:hypothetical protein QQ045_026270 [Rhodiola kirilowii]
MDIDLLLISGGWFLSSDSFMAASVASTKMSQAVITLLFVGLLLILAWSHHRPSASTSGSNTATSDAVSFTESLMGTRKLLLLSSSTHHQPASSMEFHPRTSTANRNNRSFRAAAHEVPSGPNPESNK